MLKLHNQQNEPDSKVKPFKNQIKLFALQNDHGGLHFKVLSRN